MAHLTRPAEISGVSAALFPETDFSTENSSQRIKLFTGHVIKVNMCERKRKQANILRKNTIL